MIRAKMRSGASFDEAVVAVQAEHFFTCSAWWLDLNRADYEKQIAAERESAAEKKLPRNPKK